MFGGAKQPMLQEDARRFAKLADRSAGDSIFQQHRWLIAVCPRFCFCNAAPGIPKTRTRMSPSEPRIFGKCKPWKPLARRVALSEPLRLKRRLRSTSPARVKSRGRTVSSCEDPGDLPARYTGDCRPCTFIGVLGGGIVRSLGVI